MRAITKTGFYFILVTIFACSSNKVETRNYYFDPNLGRDSNAGTSPGKAFMSLRKIGDLHLKPGDSILLKSGALFTEQLYISCMGDSVKPIVISKYGGDSKPYIKGDGSQMEAVFVFNSEHLIVRDLEISNKGPEPVDGMNGILVQLKGYGTAKDIIIENLYIHDVYGILTRDGKGGGNAIMLKNLDGDDSISCSSRFDGLSVRNCHIENCQRNGIMMWGNWVRKKWNPNLHVVICNNIIEGVPGDGIVPVACEHPVVEYNVMKDCPPTLPASEACDGIWPWSCDNAVVQFNTVSDHKSKVDGYGFDSDWNSTNSLFQYNLSYNNDGGFMLVCNPGGWPADWSIGNKGTLIRYNISINDGLRNYIQENKTEYFSPVIHMTGDVKNTLLEKNLFYVFKKPDKAIDKTILSLTNWTGYPDSTCFSNNFIFAAEPNRMVDLTKSTNTVFEKNFYVGDLKTPPVGFERYEGAFDKELWYDKSDGNWEKLLKFVEVKTIFINGVETPVVDIIGAVKHY
jgi:hypothetical protein